MGPSCRHRQRRRRGPHRRLYGGDGRWHEGATRAPAAA